MHILLISLTYWFFEVYPCICSVKNHCVCADDTGFYSQHKQPSLNIPCAHEGTVCPVTQMSEKYRYLKMFVFLSFAEVSLVIVIAIAVGIGIIVLAIGLICMKG